MMYIITYTYHDIIWIPVACATTRIVLLVIPLASYMVEEGKGLGDLRHKRLHVWSW